MTFLRALEVLFPISASLRSTQRTEARATVTKAFAIWRKEAAAAAWSPLGSAESTCCSSPTGKILLKAKSICTRRPREPPVVPGGTPASLNPFPPQEELGRLLGWGGTQGAPTFLPGRRQRVLGSQQPEGTMARPPTQLPLPGPCGPPAPQLFQPFVLPKTFYPRGRDRPQALQPRDPLGGQEQR